MLLEELKKIGIKQHVIFVLVILLIIQAGYTGSRQMYSRTVTKTAEKYADVYDEYLGKLQGKWDQKKDQWLNQCLKEKDSAQEEYASLVDQLLAGEISDEQLYTYYKNTPFSQNKYSDVLNELDEKRDYVKKDPSHRYMLKENGWTYFYEDHLIYYIYLLFLLVIFIPLFIREKESRMDILQGLSVKGQKKIFVYKILAAWLYAVAGLLLLMVEKYLIYKVRYGLEHAHYPIQSLTIFESCPWNISVGNALMVEILLLLCASFLLGAVIVLASMYIPRTLDVCLLILVLVFVPVFIFSKDILFHYPGITSYLFPDQLVYGWWDEDLGKHVYKTSRQFLIQGGSAVVAGLLFLWWAGKREKKI